MYRPSEDQIMAEARRVMQERMARDGVRTDPPQTHPYRSPSERRQRAYRSYQSCHRYRLTERRRTSPPKDTGAYVPELSARLENDPNLTDGSRRCGRKLGEYTYQRDREGRAARITVTYLMTALGRSRRTVQRYLRELESAGYIATSVLKAQTRMCAGLIIRLLPSLFPRHHAAKWPAKLIKPDAPRESQNKSQIYKYEEIPIASWALRCMDGVWRAFNWAYPPGSLLIR